MCIVQIDVISMNKLNLRVTKQGNCKNKLGEKETEKKVGNEDTKSRT